MMDYPSLHTVPTYIRIHVCVRVSMFPMRRLNVMMGYHSLHTVMYIHSDIYIYIYNVCMRVRMYLCMNKYIFIHMYMSTCIFYFYLKSIPYIFVVISSPSTKLITAKFPS